MEAHSADIIVTLAIMKSGVEVETHKTVKLIITGGTEAHLLAKELAEAHFLVILSPS